MTTISAATEPAVGLLGTEIRDWMRDAKCSGYPPEWWYPEDDESKRKGLRVCAQCPVQAQCLMWAYLVDDRWGTLGGVTQWNRTATRNRLERAGKWEKFISYCKAKLMRDGACVEG